MGTMGTDMSRRSDVDGSLPLISASGAFPPDLLAGSWHDIGWLEVTITDIVPLRGYIWANSR